MQRRRLLAVTGTSLAAAVAGCSSSDDEADDRSETEGGDSDGGDGTGTGDETENGTSDGSENEDDDPENGDDNGEGDGNGDPEPVLTTLDSIRDVDDRYDSRAVTFSGSGQAVTDEFNLAGACTAFIFEHDGEPNFAPELLDEDGDRAFLIANGIGGFDGAAAAPIDSGTYVVDVEADGDWSLELE